MASADESSAEGVHSREQSFLGNKWTQSRPQGEAQEFGGEKFCGSDEKEE